MKRLLVTVVLLLSALVPAQAQAASPALVVTAPAGRWGYLDVDHLRLIQADQLRAWTGGRPAALEITATDPHGPIVYIAVVWLPGMLSSPQLLGTTHQLDAARYRVRVLSDGPVTFSLGLASDGTPDGGAVRLRPSRPLRVTTRLAGPVATGAGAVLRDLRLPRAVPRGWSALLASFASGTFAGASRSCATSTSTCPRSGAVVDTGDWSPTVVKDPGLIGAGTYLPDATHVRDALFQLDGVSAAAGRFAGVSFAYAP